MLRPALLVLALLLGSCLPTSAAAPPPPVAKASPPLVGKSPAPLVGKAPPPIVGKAPPPLIGKAPPPLVGKASPPLVGKAPPPLAGKAPPPVAGKAPPPWAGKAPPPAAGKAPPPVVGKAPPPLRKSPPPTKKPPSPPVKRPPPRPPLKSPPLPPRPPPPPPAPPRAVCDCPMVWFTSGGSPRFGCGGGSTNDRYSPFYPNWCELDDACPSYNGILEDTGKKFKYCNPSPSACACAPTWIYNNKTYSGCITTPANFIFKAAGYKLCVVGSQCNDYLSTVKGTTPPNMKYRVCQYDTKPDACACLSSWSLVSGGTNRTFYGCSAESETLNAVPYCAVGAACTTNTEANTAVQPSNKIKYCYPDDDMRCRCMEQWVVNGTTYGGCTDSLVPPLQDGTTRMYCAVAESCPNYVGRLAGSNPANLKYRGCANDYF